MTADSLPVAGTPYPEYADDLERFLGWAEDADSQARLYDPGGKNPNTGMRESLENRAALIRRIAGALSRLPELERDAAKLEKGLAAIYPDHMVAICDLCDQHLDRSGALLGRVRDRYLRDNPLPGLAGEERPHE